MIVSLVHKSTTLDPSVYENELIPTGWSLLKERLVRPKMCYNNTMSSLKVLNQTRVDRDKPRILEFGLCFKDFGLLKCLKQNKQI